MPEVRASEFLMVGRRDCHFCDFRVIMKGESLVCFENNDLLADIFFKRLISKARFAKQWTERWWIRDENTANPVGNELHLYSAMV